MENFRYCSKEFSSFIAKIFSFFNESSNFRRDHLLPGGIATVDFGKYVAGENTEKFFFVFLDTFDIAVVEQVLVKMAKIGVDLEIFDGGNCVSDTISRRINIEFEAVFEKAAERFEDAAIKFFVIFLLEDFAQIGNTHDNADFFLRVAPEISSEAVIFSVIGDEHGLAGGVDEIGTGKKIAVINHAGGKEVVHRNFKNFNNLLRTDAGLEWLARPREHVEGNVGERPETAALN